ncbi:sulfurtransferase complex subunit TusC [Halomonas elongata]|uniref:sulfurtransferase complex subunit TusC n=1 Tax=Halomonas elongata TaxID=2746 RepID=UPI00255AFE15|nr:sulfurtransferase complex subunit TusC [Halomonas elongata]MDL4864681.1 sulfurtransferase complex subunit TusC [Halomonas elongata]
MRDSQMPGGDLLVILRHGPHGVSWLREGLDAALVGAAFGREVALLFMGEGVLALLEGQGPGALGQKSTGPTLEMLEMYDIEALYVEGQAMERYGLEQQDLLLATHHLDDASIAELVERHALVLTF